MWVKNLGISLFPLVLSLVLVLAGCSNSSGQSVTVSQLISQSADYSGKTVTLEAFYYAGFEISVLADSLVPGGWGDSVYGPEGDLIWVDKGIPQEVFDKLYVSNSTVTGYPGHYGRLRVTGQFVTGGEYGHLNAFKYQLSVQSAESLTWTPTPPSK